jgi:predicted DNA-binding transcriptional regulator AlpA
MQRRLRYADLERLGVVNNRETLQNWIRKRGFPRGQLTGPNSRTWGEDEVQRWLDSRPTAIKRDLPKATGPRGRRRKAERAGAQA